MHPNDLLSAIAPAVFGVTLAEVNDVLGALSLVMGMAYLCWKWRKEAKKPE